MTNPHIPLEEMKQDVEDTLEEIEDSLRRLKFLNLGQEILLNGIKEKEVFIHKVNLLIKAEEESKCQS